MRRAPGSRPGGSAAAFAVTWSPGGQSSPQAPAEPTTVSIAGQPRDLADLQALRAQAGSEAATDAAVAALLQVRLAAFPVKDGAVEVLDDSGVLDNLDAVELSKIVQLAADQGRSITSAIAQYGLQDEFERAADDLRIQFPDAFAGAEINRPDGSAWFAFVGELPDAARARLAALHAPTEVVTGMRHSLGSLEKVALRITQEAGVETGAGVDLASQTIDVQVMAGAPAERAEAARRAHQIAAASGVVARVQDVAAGVVDHDGYARGGSSLRGHNSDGEYHGCTMAFVMRTGTGAYRLGSAGHCHAATWRNTRMELRPVDGSTSSFIRNTMAWQDGSGDIGLWNLGTFKPMATFYAKSSMKVSVGGWIRYPAKGTAVCKFGEWSGFTCDTIKDASWSSYGQGNLVRTESVKTKSGDSGGPWFSGHTAYGVTKGSTLVLRDDVFTRMNGYAEHDTTVMVY